jgi:WD40 repeat protein
MTTLYKQLKSCKPSQADDAYILKILPSTGKGIAAITSSDELLVIDATNFESTTPLRLEDPGKGVTSLTSDNEGNHFFCGGADGVVSCFDMRSQRKVAKLEISQSARFQNRIVRRATDYFRRQANHCIGSKCT